MQIGLHTEEYSITGTVITRHERLKDLLENFRHPFLPVEGATISQLYPWREPQSEEVEQVMVRIDEVAVAIPHADIPEGQLDRSNHPQYVAKYPVQAIIHLPRMIIQGQIFIRQDEEADRGMIFFPERFLAVKGAKVSYRRNDQLLSFSADVVIVNRDHVQFLRRV